MPILHKEGFEYLVYYIGYSLRRTTVSVATYPLTMRSIRGGTLGWNIEIYSTPTNQFDWSVSGAYVTGRAKRAPHWGVQSRFRVIYIYMLSICRMSYVCCMSN